MRHVYRLLAGGGAALALWLGLLAADLPPAQRHVADLLPLYALMALAFYGLAMLGYGIMVFPTCPYEAELLQQDIREANEYFQKHGVNVGLAKPTS